MSFDSNNLLKGRVAETLTHHLFERAGYYVERFGVEDLFRGVKGHTEDSYKQLGFPESLRLLPDFVVLDMAQPRTFLVEVKFRSNFEGSMEDLRKKIETQQKVWPEVYVIILVANSPNDKKRFLRDHMRVIKQNTPLDDVFNASRNSRQRWNDLHGMTEVFVGFKDILKESDAIIEPLRALSSI